MYHYDLHIKRFLFDGKLNILNRNLLRHGVERLKSGHR